MAYRIPSVESLYLKGINDFKKLGLVTLELEVSEETTMKQGDAFKKDMESRAKCYIERYVKEGYILDVNYVVVKDYGVANTITFGGNTKYKMDIGCKLFSPKPGDILIGCKLRKITDIGLDFAYGHALIHVDGNYEKYNLKVNNKYNIVCNKIMWKIDMPRFMFRLKKSIDKGRRQYFSIETVYIRRILSKITDLVEWRKTKTERLVGQHVSVLTCENERIEIKYEDIAYFTMNYQIYGASAKIFDGFWNIPMKLRYNIILDNTGNISKLRPVISTKLVASEDEIKKYLDGHHQWNKTLKYLVNPFEMLSPAKIYSAPVIKHREVPVSRAYFKAVEIIKNFNISKISNALMLGDAPGGFTQYVSTEFPKSNTVTISLVAGLKYNSKLIARKNVKLDNMEDGTGDLLKRHNILYMLKKYRNSMDIVLCDAAIRYDEKYDKESQHTRLFISEVIISSSVLVYGGSMAIKIYQRNKKVTKKIIKLCTKMYNKVFLYKPKSVRIANNETFVICIGKKAYIDMTSLIVEKEVYVTDIDGISLQEGTVGIDEFNQTHMETRRLAQYIGIESIRAYGNDINEIKQMSIKNQIEISEKYFP